MSNRNYLLLPCASVVGVFLLIGAVHCCAEGATFPEKPVAESFYIDQAGLIGAAEAAEISRIAGSLLQEEAVPLLVVTLKDLASQGAAGYTIERYAAALFDHWGIGSPERNYGMLLLVSRGDRRARIELGESWGLGYDLQAQQIMDLLVLPEFKNDSYSEGILAGVRGMDALARGLSLPPPRQPSWFLPLSIVVFLAVSSVVFSLIYSGRRSWAWILLAALAAVIFFFLSRAGRSGNRNGGDHGGSAGGLFRGGSSGRGGATGSW
jgi:uncharacterized protein